MFDECALFQSDAHSIARIGFERRTPLPQQITASSAWP
jgi:hypothetical protein